MLAGLVGRSEDWLSKVERGSGRRRLDLLTDVARALRVLLPDLLGQPVLMEDEQRDDDVSAVRDALMSPRRLSRVLFARGSSADARPVAAGVMVESAWAEFQGGRLSRVIAALPELIATATQLEDAAGAVSDVDRRACWAVSARTHHLAATALAKVGESDLAWLAAERAMHAADQADDPLVLASAARSGTRALLAVGRYEEALDLGRTAASWLRAPMSQSDPEALSLVGMLDLRTAVAAAKRQDGATASELLNRASEAADLLGRDANYWQTGFGPTSVVLHRSAAALELGDIAFVVENGPGVDAEHLPVERRVSHRIDLGRAMSLVARDEDALEHFVGRRASGAAAGAAQRHGP